MTQTSFIRSLSPQYRTILQQRAIHPFSLNKTLGHAPKVETDTDPEALAASNKEFSAMLALVSKLRLCKPEDLAKLCKRFVEDLIPAARDKSLDIKSIRITSNIKGRMTVISTAKFLVDITLSPQELVWLTHQNYFGRANLIKDSLAELFKYKYVQKEDNIDLIYKEQEWPRGEKSLWAHILAAPTLSLLEEPSHFHG
ncbi:MAG: hypothetical protein HQ564_09815 [Candidatus Saganbacteria bacterium]|nr:hypothetical protein [Candidatus Saganbacteria bacterium]